MFGAGRKITARTLEYLRRNPIQLNDKIHTIQVVFSKMAPDHLGTRLFLFTKVPPIKYHNPNVVVRVNKSPTNEKAAVHLVLANGQVCDIYTKDKRPEAILDDVLSAAGLGRDVVKRMNE
eukprot:Opistho-2@30234